MMTMIEDYVVYLGLLLFELLFLEDTKGWI